MADHINDGGPAPKFQSLLAAKSSLDFWGTRSPLCPHCGAEVDISANDLYRIYEEGEHEISCPDCDEDFMVSTRVHFTFSTDEQEGLDAARSQQKDPTK